MEIKTVVTASEAELVALIEANLDEDFDSIVAEEEIGNQVWVVEVTLEPLNIDDLDSLYKTRPYLNELCHQGIIPAGTYMVDCTW
jgi:hypothetical protein